MHFQLHYHFLMIAEGWLIYGRMGSLVSPLLSLWEAVLQCGDVVFQWDSLTCVVWVTWSSSIELIWKSDDPVFELEC